MTSVATFEFRTDLTMAALKEGASQYWQGKGYQVDVYLWWSEQPDRFFCVLEYFYHCDPLELTMLVDTANYFIGIAKNQTVYYYRCFDFVGDRDPEKSAYKSGEDLETLNPSDLHNPEYHPSMSACDIYLLQPVSKGRVSDMRQIDAP
jgi:hypothetical protein